MKELIRFENVTYTTTTNREIFCDLSLSVRKDKIGIIGRNGVGKSLLVKLISGEVKPTFGKILRNSEICVVPQIIDFQQTILWNLLEGIDTNLRNGTVDFSVKKVLKKINYNFYKTKENIKELSGGELRMLYIISAFCDPADILVLDEPESDLDIDNRQLLRNMVLGSNKTIIIISHDRKTLDCVENIMEIKEQGVTIFGGGYSQYLMEKSQKELSLDRRIKQISNEIDNIEVLKESVINNQNAVKMLEKINTISSLSLDDNETIEIFNLILEAKINKINNNEICDVLSSLYDNSKYKKYMQLIEDDTIIKFYYPDDLATYSMKSNEDYYNFNTFTRKISDEAIKKNFDQTILLKQLANYNKGKDIGYDE